MHAFNGAGLRILASLTAALSFDGALANEISGRIALKVGGLKLLDTPRKGRKEGQGIGRLII